MKTIVIILTSLLFIENSFCQARTRRTEDIYLEKNNTRETAALIVLGAGLGIMITGFIVQSNHDTNIPPCNNFYGCWDFDFTGYGIAAIGGAMSLLSIPFFISSSKNKRKAGTLTLSNQQIYLPEPSAIVLTSHPALTIKINF